MQGFEDINRVSWDWVLSCGSEDKGSYIPANFWDVSQSAANQSRPGHTLSLAACAIKHSHPLFYPVCKLFSCTELWGPASLH